MHEIHHLRDAVHGATRLRHDHVGLVVAILHRVILIAFNCKTTTTPSGDVVDNWKRRYLSLEHGVLCSYLDDVRSQPSARPKDCLDLLNVRLIDGLMT